MFLFRTVLGQQSSIKRDAIDKKHCIKKLKFDKIYSSLTKGQYIHYNAGVFIIRNISLPFDLFLGDLDALVRLDVETPLSLIES